jgi:hypothetical protein
MFDFTVLADLSIEAMVVFGYATEAGWEVILAWARLY